jgi:hypothetical protein
VKRIALAAALLVCAARATTAQLPPNEHWKTLHTRHFRVHFTPPLEQEARRAAVNAERAYTELAAELVPPRGTIDLVVADNVDFTNGYATPYPSNRIVVYAHPPTDASGLRNYEDWNALVVTHELTHIFDLDRSRGIWRVAQAIFGRHPLLFPNEYEPSWVLEGLAVYYESRLTGVGRLESSEHSMIARAAALANRVPTLQELSPTTSRFPGGEVVYVYGSLLFDYLSRTRGPASIRDFIERGAKTPLPFVLTFTSRSAFGESFQTAWTAWRDSLVREMKMPHAPIPDWRELTKTGRLAAFPRWLGDTAILYSGDKGREVPALYEISLDGRETNLGRRNGTSPNVRLPDGSILFSQPEFLDPYHLREDLYIQRDGHQSRLTRGARLSLPDVRNDGEIVAVQSLPATSRLVRLSWRGGAVTPITPTDLDTQWLDPRWSPDGLRIVAIRQSRGTSEFVVLDQNGQPLMSFGSSRAISSDPSWSPDGRRIYFSSERNGMPQIYSADLSTTPVSIARLTDAATGLFSPELSPDQSRLASVVFLVDGDHIGVAPVPTPLASSETDQSRPGFRRACAGCLDIPTGLAPLGAADTSKATTYSPWRSLLPRYWEPVFFTSTFDGTSFGAATSGYDIVSRHQYAAQALHNQRYDENSAFLSYRYAGFGLPLIDFVVLQDYSNTHFSHRFAADTAFGVFMERDRIASLQATFVRPRVRTNAFASIGAELETMSFATTPDSLLQFLSAVSAESHTLPSIVASAGWTNTKRPGLSISPEDGVSASVSARQRWDRSADGLSTRSLVGVTSVYKSLDFPGFAHHVLALRAAGAVEDERSPDSFSAGGISGTSVQIFPGLSAGERRPFGVRGYPTSAEQGTRAYSGALEYRAPLTNPSRGFRFIPVFFDKTALSLFGEAGRAFCPTSAVASNPRVCSASAASNPVMTSVGAELNIDSGIQLDFPTRLRLGAAFPLTHRQELKASVAALYATFGASF